MKLLTVVLSIAMTGCVSMAMQDFNRWNADARPKAESGELLWSDYYKQGYEQASKVPDSTPAKGLVMMQAALLIDAAKAMESGAMSKDDFHSLQRKAQAELRIALERDEMQRQAMAAQWIQTQALIQQRYNTPHPVSCTTSKVGNFLQTNCR